MALFFYPMGIMALPLPILSIGEPLNSGKVVGTSSLRAPRQLTLSLNAIPLGTTKKQLKPFGFLFFCYSQGRVFLTLGIYNTEIERTRSGFEMQAFPRARYTHSVRIDASPVSTLKQ